MARTAAKLPIFQIEDRIADCLAVPVESRHFAAECRRVKEENGVWESRACFGTVHEA
jgi:hypothetical protein